VVGAIVVVLTSLAEILPRRKIWPERDVKNLSAATTSGRNVE